jgi:hypothetical protein
VFADREAAGPAALRLADILQEDVVNLKCR